MVDRRSIREISVLYTSNEKSNFQNDMMELYVALAKKIVHMFEKSMKNP